MKKLLLLLLALYLFSGCSSHVFEPEIIIGKRTLTQEYDKKITMQHLNGITYKDGSSVSFEGELEGMKLPEGYAYLNETLRFLIAADNGGSVMLMDKDTKEQRTFTFAHRILSATLKGKLLAVVSSKNSMHLLDIETNSLVFKFTSTEPIAVDIRLANPVFNNELIFFPSLDGKVQIYSKDQNKMIRTMSVSTEEKFNNIIFFKIFKKKVIAATGSSLYLFGKDIVKKELPIRMVLFEDQALLVLTKDGTIARYTLDLEEQGSIKLKFAHYIGVVNSPTTIYLLESEGYMIKVSHDLATSRVYKFDYGHEKVFSGRDRFYLNSGYFLPN